MLPPSRPMRWPGRFEKGACPGASQARGGVTASGDRCDLLTSTTPTPALSIKVDDAMRRQTARCRSGLLRRSLV
jgi:hypothetical protein